jgi:hypothetical protein
MKTFLYIISLTVFLTSCTRDKDNSLPDRNALFGQYFGYIDKDKEFNICIEYLQSSGKDILSINSVNYLFDEFNLHFNNYAFTLDTIESSYWDYSPDRTDSCLATSSKSGYGKFNPENGSIELTLFEKSKWCASPTYYDTTNCKAIKNSLIEYEGVYYHLREDFDDSVFITKSSIDKIFEIRIKSSRLANDSISFMAELGCTGLIGLNKDLSPLSYSTIEFIRNSLYMSLPFPQKDPDWDYTFNGFKVGKTNLP